LVRSEIGGYCCETMQHNATHKCEQHPNPFDCPDNLIYHNERSNQFGLIIHDGGGSFISIQFCPWCGKQLEGMARKATSTAKRRKLSDP
jgi:hypothetical protein